MGLGLRLRRGAVVAVVALALPGAPCAVAQTATPSPTPSPTVTLPSPTASVPSEADVTRARDAAAAAAKEVADLTAKVAAAEARLEALQRSVAQAVTADQQAQQRLADAEAAVSEAGDRLEAAQRRRARAERLLSGRAAQMYMGAGDLQDATTLLLATPDAMSDLVVVLDRSSREVTAHLDAARAAARDAASEQRQLASARDARATAVADAGARRRAAQAAAAAASTEAAQLGQQQEALTARLLVLRKSADDLVALREAAAQLGPAALLGVQGNGALGGAPKEAQDLAHAKMPAYGWDDAEFACLVPLWQAESGWSWSATNTTSGAYGIPQALPGWKMASAGSDWLTNPATQITWGLGYIASTYGSPCRAYEQFLARSPHWY